MKQKKLQRPKTSTGDEMPRRPSLFWDVDPKTTDQPLNQSIHPDNTIEPKGLNQLGFNIVIAVVVILLVISLGIYWLISNLNRNSSQTLSPSQQETTTSYIHPTEVPTAREPYFADIIQQNCRIFGEVAESMEHKPRYMRLEDLPVKIDSKVAAKIVSNRRGIIPDKNYPVVCTSYNGKYHLGIEGDNFIYLSIITTLPSHQSKKVIKESGYGSLALVYENVGTDAPQSEFIFAYGEKNFTLNKDETLYITFSLRLMDEKDPRFEEIKKIILYKDSPLFNDLLYPQLSQSSAEKDNLDFVEEVLQGITKI